MVKNAFLFVCIFYLVTELYRHTRITCDWYCCRCNKARIGLRRADVKHSERWDICFGKGINWVLCFCHTSMYVFKVILGWTIWNLKVSWNVDSVCKPNIFVINIHHESILLSVYRRIIRYLFYHDDKFDVFLPATITQKQYGQLFDIFRTYFSQ